MKFRMLCEFAHSFPDRIAEFLERDRGRTRNFREETVTDLLMASLIGLEPFGVKVDFPDEPATGGDMQWIYAAPCEINGGRYLRLILQAKRAQSAQLKGGQYWYYRHLDHGNPPGRQAQTLIGHATTLPGTLPLYIFYHPISAITPAAGLRPAVEGVNIVFASKIAPIVNGGCSRNEKKIDYWRDDFLPLSDLLCWPTVVTGPATPPPPDVTQFVVSAGGVFFGSLSSGFHPDLVARRFRERRERVRMSSPPGVDVPAPPPIEPVDGIPDDIRRAIDGKMSVADRKGLRSPRVILSTKITRADPDYFAAEQAIRQG